MEELELYCNECHSNKSMVKVKIPVSSKLKRTIGMIVAIVSTIGIMLSVILIFRAYVESLRIDANPIAFVIERLDVAYSLFFLMISMPGTVIGLLLLKKKKGYKCIQCGHVERTSSNNKT